MINLMANFCTLDLSTIITSSIMCTRKINLQQFRACRHVVTTSTEMLDCGRPTCTYSSMHPPRCEDCRTTCKRWLEWVILSNGDFLQVAHLFGQYANAAGSWGGCGKMPRVPRRCFVTYMPVIGHILLGRLFLALGKPSILLGWM